MALFTGKGDGGTTKVFGCDQARISKASELPEALGALDELNSFLGFTKMRAKVLADTLVPGAGEGKTISAVLREVQEALFIVQAETAGAEKHIGKDRVEWEEAMIYAIEKEIPPIKSFSIAGGTELSAMIDVARTFARRAERRLVAASDVGARALLPETKAFMNRLSSLLFALSRYVNHAAGVPEENPKY